jgi:hypothetical protein
MRRALKGMTKGLTPVMHLKKTSTINFEELKRINEALPVFFLPMFQFQDTLRTKVRTKL